MNMEDLIDRVNKNISRVAGKSDKFFPKLYKDAMLNEGKRLRAKIFFAVCQDTSEKSIKIAAAIELFHSATLIHDDILDDAKLRRGRPALYTKHGISSSLLYGDFLFSSAFSLIAELDDNEIYRQITSALKEVLEGEMVENYRRRDITLTKAEYLSIIEKKSGTLFGLAARLGALIRGMGKEEIENLYQFGVNAGMAYQMIDDYSDYFGNDEDKDKFKDINEGLVTLPLIYLLERCSSDEKIFISSILNENRENRDTEGVVSLMEYYDVPGVISAKIKSFIERTEMFLPKSVSGDLKDSFDVLLWMGDKIGNVKKEYCNSGRGVCRS